MREAGIDGKSPGAIQIHTLSRARDGRERQDKDTDGASCPMTRSDNRAASFNASQTALGWSAQTCHWGTTHAETMLGSCSGVNLNRILACVGRGETLHNFPA